MALRRYVVRRYVNHSDRTVVLPDAGGSPSPRRGDYDDYERPRPVPTREEPSVDARLVPEASRGPCPECGRTVRFNQRRQYYYSHTMPGSSTLCPLSGRG